MRPPISSVPYQYLVMIKMFKMENKTPEFFEQLKKDVATKCSEYGIIERIFVEKNNQGNVWIKFSDTETCKKAHYELNGKFFDGQKVICYFVGEETYQKRVGLWSDAKQHISIYIWAAPKLWE